MFIYAGIDEAGYGPMFGPLVVGRSVFAVHGGSETGHGDIRTAEKHAEGESHPAGSPTPDLWLLLSSAVCRDRKSTRRGRIAVNDSKKLYSPSVGIRYLELGVLTFSALADQQPTTVGKWLDTLGEKSHHDLQNMPWYAPDGSRPWEALPSVLTEGEVAIARSMLASAAKSAGVEVLELGASVVFEDRFNRMVAATRSKAATNFTFVTDHLQKIWRGYAEKKPTVIVDRQSGRTHYRSLLSMGFPDTELTILHERDDSSAYLIESGRDAKRAMTVQFKVEAEAHHLPVALASMISKYTRELLMHRFQQWFSQHAPSVKPTAGYAKDANRFWNQIQTTLTSMSIEPMSLRRMS